MNIAGAGTGKLTYQINDEQMVQDNPCGVTGAEDDEDGALVLSLSFDDPNHGTLEFGLTVQGFSPGVEVYDDVSVLTMFVHIVNSGVWQSAETSDVRLKVTVTESEGEGESSCSYAGTFSAGGLVGSDGQLALTIVAASYSLTMHAQEMA